MDRFKYKSKMYIFKMFFLILLLSIGFLYALPRDGINPQLVVYLHAGKPHIQNAPHLLQMFYYQNRVQVYCKLAQPLRLWNIFQSSYLQLEIAQEAEYSQYVADTANGISIAHDYGHEIYDSKLLTRGFRYIALRPHAASCFGIFTEDAYNVTLLEQSCDYERLTQFGLGLILYAAAPTLGQSLRSCYCTTAVLGAYVLQLVAVVLVWLHCRYLQVKSLQKLFPLHLNYKLILRQHRSVIVIAMIPSTWIMGRWCKLCKAFWSYKFVPLAHRCLLRFIAYYFIFFASDHKGFSYFVVGLLLLYSEIWWLLRHFRSQRYNEHNANCEPGRQNSLQHMCQRCHQESTSLQNIAQFSEGAPLQQISNLTPGFIGVQTEPVRDNGLPSFASPMPTPTSRRYQLQTSNLHLHAPFTGEHHWMEREPQELRGSIRAPQHAVMDSVDPPLETLEHMNASVHTLYRNMHFRNSAGSVALQAE